MSEHPNLPPMPEQPKAVRTRRLQPLKRVIPWSFAALLCLVLLLAAAAGTLLRSPRFHRYVLTQAQQRATAQLGSQVELQNYSLSFSGLSPSLTLYGLTVHGAVPYANPPVLQVEQARVGVRVVSLLRKAWYLDEVTVHRPVVQLRVNADGSSNLPHPKSSGQSNGIQQLFDLAIRHAMLDGGELYYNDRKTSLDADLRDVTLDAAYDPAQNVYNGRLAYTDAHLRAVGCAPMAHALSADFTLSPTALDLHHAELRSGASSLAIDGRVENFDNPHAAVNYHASIDGAQLREMLRQPQVPTGTVILDGHASYAANANEPVLNSLTVEGTLHSERLEFRGIAAHADAAHTSRASYPVAAEARAVHASYRLANGDAELRSFTADLLGGRIDASGTLRHLTGTQLGSAHVRLDGISLAELRRLAPPDAVRDVTIEGTTSGSVEVAWSGSLKNLTATADATLQATAGSTHSKETVPVTGEVHANYRNADEQLSLHRSYLRTAHSILSLDGTTGASSRMKLDLQAGDLHELESIAAIFRPDMQPLALAGSAQFGGTLSGPTSAPQLAGQLSGSNIKLRGAEWTMLRAQIDASPDAASITDGELVPAPHPGYPRARVTFSGRAALQQWSFTPSSAFQVSLHGQGMDAGRFAQLIGLSTPLSGTLNANLEAHGSQLNPIGQGRVELLRASFAGEPIQSLVADLNGDGEAIHAKVNLAMTAGVATGTLTYQPRERAYQVQLQSANFQLAKLDAIRSRNLPITGAMNLTASGRGTIDDPQLTARIEIPQLHVEKQSAESIQLNADVAQHAAKLKLTSRAVQANISGDATIQLSGDYQAEATLDTSSILLQPLLVLYAPAQAESLSGSTEFHATMRGPLRHREQIEAHFELPKLDLHYGNSIQIGAAGPIRADYANGTLHLQRAELKGTGSELRIEGSLPLLDHTKPVALLAIGTIDLRLVQLFDSDLTSSGQLRFNINSAGARSDPNVEGDVHIVNATVTMAGAPVGLVNGNGTLAFTGDRLNITSFQGSVGGGQVTATGGIAYRPSLQFDIALKGEGIRMLYPDGVRSMLSSNLTLTGTREQATIRGQVNIDQLSFTPDFQLSNLNALTSDVQEPPTNGFADSLRLDVALRSTQNVSAVNRTMSLDGSANLRLTGTVAEPVVLGRISITSGDLVFQGNHYVLNSGVVNFINPTRTEPNVSASMNTTVQEYNIGIRLEGTLENLRTSYSSDPALPPADIINLLAFGKTNEAQAAGPQQSVGQSAQQLIASQVSSQVTNRVERLAGISQLSIDPTLGTGQQNGGANITVQQRVTSKIFITYSTDVTSTQQQVLQLQYQATPKVSVSGTRDQNGGFGFETRIRREW